MNFSTNGWIFTLFQGAGKSRGEATLLIDSPTAFPVYFLPTNRPTWRGSSGHPVSAQVLSYNNPTWTRSCPARMRGSIFVLIFITKICKYLCGLWEFVQLAVPLRKQGGGGKTRKTRKTRRKRRKAGPRPTVNLFVFIHVFDQSLLLLLLPQFYFRRGARNV